ncbi:MAG: lipopolysaccharide biosynthesis protein [Verrucomicrobia bacterium]|nr:lipopolysaccharide biosynthesis protein [Verrucomicrobiota bacterium]MCF7707981.1 lipopolysaccharide biosynthesis protein [Verrucomicrobiota bacterium]
MPTGTIARGAVFLTGSNVLAQGLSVFTSPIITRLYTREDFGCAGVFQSFLTILVIVATLRYDVAITQTSNKKEAVHVLYLAAVLVGIAGTVVFATGLFGGELLTRLTDTPGLEPFWWMLGLGIIGLGLFTSMDYLALREKLIKVVSKTKIIQSASGVTTTLVFGILLNGPLGLLLGIIVAHSAGITNYIRELFFKNVSLKFRPEWSEVKEAGYKFRRYPQYFCAAGVLNTTGLFIVVPLLSGFYGSEVAGTFALAQRIIIMPMRMIGMAIGQAFLSEASARWRERPSDLPGMVRKVQKGMLPLVVLTLVGGAVSPWLFPIVFGAEWAESGLYVAIMIPAFGMQLLVSPISSVSYILKRQDLQLILDSMRVVWVLISLVIPGYFGWEPIYAIVFYSVAMLITYLVNYASYKYIVRKAIITQRG